LTQHGGSLLREVLVQAFFIPSTSMEPTMHGCPGCVGDRVLVNKLVTHLAGVHRGDIVVFHKSAGWLNTASVTPVVHRSLHSALGFIGLAPATGEGDLVKQVIGVGGDTVEGRGGRVYVNGPSSTSPTASPATAPPRSISGDRARRRAVGDG
jgi:signal peptidase I